MSSWRLPDGGLKPELMRWLREPAVQFFTVGIVLFGVYTLLAKEPAQTIRLSEAGLATLIREFELLTGRTASAADRARVIAQYYERELLYREALRTEIYRDDPQIRALLVERMQQQVTGAIPVPDGKALVNFYADNMQRYYSEATISFEQIFFASLPQNSEAILSTLRAGGALATDSAWQGKRFPDYGLSMVRGLFGQSLLDTLQALPLGEWSGPFESVDGWHWFRVSERRAARLLPFEQVRQQVYADLQAEIVSQRVADFVAQKRIQYPLESPR